jgi:hypothetical protein
VRFDPNSRQAIQGLKFQGDVQKELEKIFYEVIPVRDWLLSIDSQLSSRQLNLLEQTWGDLVVRLSPQSEPIFVECVSLNYENSRFPESKVRKFSGDNKFYAFGWEGEITKYIPSATWNAYARKLGSLSHFGRPYRKFSRRHIRGVRKGCIGGNDFKSLFEMNDKGE